MGARSAVGHMDHGLSEHGRNQIWTARRHGDPRSLLPLTGQWEWWKYSTWWRHCFGCRGRGVEIPPYDANLANLDDFILDSEDLTQEVVG